jgi:hypothetical protein
MGIEKCIKCRTFVDADEVIWVRIDHTHDAPYCVDCSPDNIEEYDSDDDVYVPDSEKVIDDHEE